MPLLANSLRTISAALIVAAALVATLVLGQAVLVPLALSVISCFVLVPVVRWLEKHSLPDWLAVSSVVVVVTGLLVGASVALSSQLLSLAADLPDYRSNVLKKVHTVVGGSVPSGVVSRAIDAVESYQQMLDQEFKLSVNTAAAPTSPPDSQKQQNVVVTQDGESGAWRGIEMLAEPVAQTALTFLFTLFLLMQYKDLRDRVVRVFGTDNMTETTAAMSDAGDRLSALFTGQAILNASFGFFVGCVLLIVGVPNAPLWGCVAFVMRFVPFIGAYIAAIPPVLLAAAVDPGWTMTLSTLAVFLIGEPIMGQVIEPFFLGKRAGLSPFAMVLATSFWTLLWGPIGLLLATPITLVLVVLGRYIPNLEFVSVLLGDEPPLSEQHDFYHRLLSGDAYAAVDQIEEAKESASSEAVLDNLVFPALGLAVTDRRRGRLDAETIKELEETLDEVASTALPSEASEDARVLLVPVRGAFDCIASRFSAGAINARSSATANTIVGSSGLTALSSIDGEAAGSLQKVVFVTIVGIGEKAFSFLATKAAQKFPNAHILKLDLTRPAGSISEESRSGEEPQSFSRLTDLMSALKPSSQVTDSPIQSHSVAVSASYTPELSGSH